MKPKIETGTGILKAYFTGECTAEEERAIDNWYNSLEHNRKRQTLPPDEAAELEQKLWNLIRKRIDEADGEFDNL